jgi:hypothetical protein
MLESSKTATSTRPDWFQLTDLERLKKQYWICKGTNNFIKLDLPQSLGQRLVCWWRRVWSFPKLKTSQVLIVIYCSAEEAEAHSCIPSRYCSGISAQHLLVHYVKQCAEREIWVVGE